MDFCLPQLVLMVILHVLHCLYIYDPEFFCDKDGLFSPVYLFIQSFINRYRLMDISFIIWAIVQYCQYLLLRFFPALSIVGSFSRPLFLVICLHSFLFFSCFVY